MSDEKKPATQNMNLPHGIKLRIDEPTAQGQYSNMQVVGSNETEFVLDFAYLPPNQRGGKVNSRIILSPKHAKGMLRLLSERVRDYEARFGPIVLPQGKPPGGGTLIN
jgi:hypothetical protein